MRRETACLEMQKLLASLHVGVTPAWLSRRVWNIN